MVVFQQLMIFEVYNNKCFFSAVIFVEWYNRKAFTYFKKKHLKTYWFEQFNTRLVHVLTHVWTDWSMVRVSAGLPIIVALRHTGLALNKY